MDRTGNTGRAGADALSTAPHNTSRANPGQTGPEPRRGNPMLKTLPIFVVVVVLGVLGLAAFQPERFRDQRQFSVSAAPDTPFALVNAFHQHGQADRQRFRGRTGQFEGSSGKTWDLSLQDGLRVTGLASQADDKRSLIA